MLLTSSLPIAAYLNRNPQSFGNFIGKWVMVRNFFEYGIHIVFLAMPKEPRVAASAPNRRVDSAPLKPAIFKSNRGPGVSPAQRRSTEAA